MARSRGRIGGGGLLDHLVIRVDLDISGFLRSKALLIQEIRTMRGAITGSAGGVGLQDVMTAALVAPTIAAIGHLRTLRNEMRLLRSEMGGVLAIGHGGPAPGGRNSGSLIVPVPGGPVLDATRSRLPVRGSGGRMTRGYGFEGDDLAGAAGGDFGGGAAAGAAGAAPRRRGSWFGRMFNPGRTADAFESGRNNFPGYAEATDNLGSGAHSVGAAGRRAAGSRIASVLGLVGLGALFGDLVRLAASLATVLGGALAGAFAALMTPLGAVVALVTALVALFVAANWDQFKAFGEWFAERWRDVIGGEGMGAIIAGWNNLKGAFVELWDALKAIFSEDDSTSITSVLKFFGEVAIRVVHSVMEAFGGLLEVAGELVRALAALFRGDLQQVFLNLQRAVGAALNTILQVFLAWFPEMRGPWDQFWQGFEDRAKTAIDNIRNWARTHLPNFGGGTGNVSPRELSGGGRGGQKSAVNDNGKPRGGSKALPSTGYGLAVSGDRFAGIENATPGDLSPAMERTRRAAEQAGDAIIGMFDRAATGGYRFKDLLADLVAQLAQITIRSALIDPLAGAIQGGIGSLFGGGGGKKGMMPGDLPTSRDRGGGILGAIGSFFAGFFADGGFIPPGMFGVVGERGPEIARGGRHGLTISPNGGGSGFAYNDNRVYDMRGASVEAVQRLEAMRQRDRAEIPSMIRATVGDMRQRGRL